MSARRNPGRRGPSARAPHRRRAARHRRPRRCASSRTPRCRPASRSCRESSRAPSDDRGMAGDRRAARAVEHGEERALAAPAPSRCRHDRSAPAARACARRPRASRCRSRPARPPAGIRRRRAPRSPHRRGRAASSPASASSVASTSPSSSLRSRVSTLPRNGTTSRSGRSRRTSAWRRSDAVPTAAPCGSSRERPRLAADEGVARRPRAAGTPTAPGRPAATSACPWPNAPRDRSSPASSASSISLVNRPLPPASASGRSWMRSPVVRITSNLDPLRDRAVRRAPARRAPCAACASASGLPRVPIRRIAVADCRPDWECDAGPRNG